MPNFFPTTLTKQQISELYEPIFNVSDALNITITFKPFFQASDTVAAFIELKAIFTKMNIRHYLITTEPHKIDTNRKHYHCIIILPEQNLIGYRESFKVPYIDKKSDIKYNNAKTMHHIDISRKLFNFFNSRYGRTTVYWNNTSINPDTNFETYYNYCIKTETPYLSITE